MALSIFGLEEYGVLFVADILIVIQRKDYSCKKPFICALKQPRRKGVRNIYFGYGDLIMRHINKVVQHSSKILKQIKRVTQIMSTKDAMKLVIKEAF